MALIQIICPRCDRHGYVSANRLPGVLRCSDCGLVHMAQGGPAVRSRTAAQINAEASHFRPKEARKRVRKRLLAPLPV